MGTRTVHVAIIDDDAINRKLIALRIGSIIKKKGYVPVMHVYAGGNSFRAAIAAGARFDLIITDWQMPDGDGLSVIQTIVGMSLRPIIIFSGADSQSISSEIAAVCDTKMLEQIKVINKPKVADLFARVNDIIM